MNRRRLIGGVALGLLLLLGFGSRYVAALSQDNWAPFWQMAYLIALFAAFIAAFYDRENLPEKAWDFNPKRGLLYFLLGWIVFPLMIGIDAAFGSDFTLGHMLIGTLALSVLVGLAGSFTENVGV